MRRSQHHEDTERYDEMRRIFSPLADRELTAEDLREIRSNLLGFFGVLREWHVQSEAVASDSPATSKDIGSR